MAKPDRGTKRLCASCSAKFYDLSKTPITCPKCGTIFEIAPVTSRPRPDQARAARKPEAPAVEDAELISLEEADAEAQDKKAPAEDTFIEEEAEDTDVSEIIGGDIEDEKET